MDESGGHIVVQIEIGALKFSVNLADIGAAAKRQRTGALPDASRTGGPQNIAPASWTAAALRRFSNGIQTAPRLIGIAIELGYPSRWAVARSADTARKLPPESKALPA